MIAYLVHLHLFACYPSRSLLSLFSLCQLIFVSPEVAAATVPVLRAAGAQEAMLAVLQAQARPLGWSDETIMSLTQTTKKLQ
jgi:hypothetical protein